MIKQFNTAQEACDYSVQQIVAQGGQCYDVVNDACLHSDGQGNHCAIGWLLDPNNKELMGYISDIKLLVDDFPDDVPQIIKHNLDLFAALQDFHDQPDSIIRENYRDRLRDNYKIDTSAPHWQQWVDRGEDV
jgi:hypothetical protein